MRLAIIGMGRMGREVASLARQQGHDVTLTLGRSDNPDGAGLTRQALSGVEAAIEFTEADSVLANIRGCARAGVPIVVGTTGWQDRLEPAMNLVQEHGSAMVWGANFSIGAHAFLQIVTTAARLLGGYADYDSYVFEHHHAGKVDAPSGTASSLADRVLEGVASKTRMQIGNPEGRIAAEALHVVSLRSGAAFGQHRVGFDSEADSVELVHTARNRRGFARGALLAAERVQGLEGTFEFSALLDMPPAVED